ncbi:MAG: hypothetical protein ACJZ37_03250 [Candidatus Poseidoniales archaeon]
MDSEHHNLSESNLAVLLVVTIYSLYGLVDDLIDLNRIFKLILPITFAFPLISIISPTVIILPFLGAYNLDIEIIFEITRADIFKLLIIPVYVMVVANLVNMHSGYNGLQSGLSLILLASIITKSYLDESINSIIFVSAFLGSLLAFWTFNFFPAKVFEGNVGSQLFGSLIGCTIVLQEYWLFGFFILLPHTFNFFLWLVWLYLMKKNPKEYLEPDGKHKKFGKIKADGSIEVPNVLTLKWIPNHFVRIGEHHSVVIMYGITLFFCITGLFFL